jgi:classical protein kinase C
MANEDEVSRSIIQKIEREKALITAANSMRQSTNNPAVLQGLDTKIRDGRKNIEYLESRLRDHQMKQMNSRMESSSLADNSGYGQQGQGQGGYARPGEYGDPGQDYSQLSGGTGMMPPAAPFARPGPGAAAPRSRPNYSKLGRIPCKSVARACKSNSFLF